MTLRRGRRRILGAVLTLICVVVSGCTSGSSAEPADEPAIVTTTSPVPGAIVAGQFETRSPHEVLVATVRPEVRRVDTFDAPGGAPVRFELSMRNPWYFDTRLVFLVLEGREGDAWLRVSLPTRPNGSTAWIRATDVTLQSHRKHVTVSLGERKVRVFDDGGLILETSAVIGARSTPTPVGRFFINLSLPQSNPRGAYGSWILGLSGFSEALSTFNGGLPALALHGTGRPDQVGQALSNGCIRVPNHIIERLVDVLPLGTPVDVVA
jgi:hypothetical protein